MVGLLGVYSRGRNFELHLGVLDCVEILVILGKEWGMVCGESLEFIILGVEGCVIGVQCSVGFVGTS